MWIRNQINWGYLNDLETNEAFQDFTSKLNTIIDFHAPLKHVKISPKQIIRDPWMTRGLLTSSHTCEKLFRKCIRKTRTKYRNLFNRIKQRAKRTYYSQLFYEYKNDITNTWKTINNIISKTNDKTSIPQTFIINNKKYQIQKK